MAVFQGIKRKIKNKNQPAKPAKPHVEVIDAENYIIEINGQRKTMNMKLFEWLIENFHRPTHAMDRRSYLERLRTIKHNRRMARDWDRAIRRAPVIGKIETMPNHILDELIEDRLHLDINLKDRFPKIVQRVEAKRAEIAEQKRIKQIESLKHEQEMQTFPSKFRRLCGYLTIKEYKQELVDSAEQASLEELGQAQKWLLSETANLTRLQKTEALAWLNIQINIKTQQKDNSASNKPMKKKTSRLGFLRKKAST